MDSATLIGLIAGTGVVLGAMSMGQGLGIFVNVPSFLVVVGGTSAAILIRFPLEQVGQALSLGMRVAFTTRLLRPRSIIDAALEAALIARQKGPLGLEAYETPDPFFQKGLQMVVDGHGEELIRQTMLRDKEMSLYFDEIGERIFRAMADSAPAFGMIGTLIGLVQMLSNMQDPKSIGPAMAVALLTTLYGALISNLVAIPIADKLEAKAEDDRLLKSLIIEAVLQIQQRQNPSVMSDLLEAFLEKAEREQLREDLENPERSG